MLRIGKTLWKKKKKVGRHIPDIKTYYKVTVIKAMYYFFKVDRWINGTDLKISK